MSGWIASQDLLLGAGVLAGLGGARASRLKIHVARHASVTSVSCLSAAAVGAAWVAGDQDKWSGGRRKGCAMCSFLVSSWLLSNLTYVNFFMRPRGPDLTTHINLHNFTFVHNLLHMTGERIPQPFTSDDRQVVLVYNGEIYNFKALRPESTSDGEALVPLYLQRGDLFPRMLDGEFAIALLDFRRRRAIISSEALLI
eukprot:s818_g26.t1